MNTTQQHTPLFLPAQPQNPHGFSATVRHRKTLAWALLMTLTLAACANGPAFQPISQSQPQAQSSNKPKPISAPSNPTQPAANVPPAAVYGSTSTKPVSDSASITWAWPSAAPVSANYAATKNKGIDLAGLAGDPVYAAADGEVVIASRMRGYGNMVVIKHNDEYLSAYAHNRKILVREDQKVKRGDKIAEMGQVDTDSVKLHFQIRKSKVPIDPQMLLPRR